MAVTVGELNVNINVDITETIRGLKAIQREAKKAAQALRELEAAVDAGTVQLTGNPDVTITGGTINADENGVLAILNRDHVIPRKTADEFVKAVRELPVTIGPPDVKVNAISLGDVRKIADKLAKAVQTEYTHDGRRFRRTDYGNGYDRIEEVCD